MTRHVRPALPKRCYGSNLCASSTSCSTEWLRARHHGDWWCVLLPWWVAKGCEVAAGPWNMPERSDDQRKHSHKSHAALAGVSVAPPERSRFASGDLETERTRP